MSRKPVKKTLAKKTTTTPVKKVAAKAKVSVKSAPHKKIVTQKAAQTQGTAGPAQPAVTAATKPATSYKRWLSYGLLAATLVAAGYLVFSFTQYARSPAYAVQQALYAAQHHKVKSFDKYVDTMRFSAYLVDDLLTQPEQPTLPEGTGRTQNELLNLLKPGLSKTVEGQMLTLVEKGFGTPEEGNLLAAITRKIWNDSTSLAGIQTLTEDDKNAVVALSLFRTDFNNTLALNLRLGKPDGQWEVVAADNLPFVLQQLDRLETLRREAANKEVATRIQTMLTARDFQKGEIVKDKALILRASFENTGAQPITGFAAAVVLFDSQRTVLGQFNITSDKIIEPGAFLEQSWSFKLDGQNPDHTALLATPYDKLGHQIEIYSLSLDDGTTLVYEK